MYEEGDIADGPNGQTLIFRGGQWVPMGGAQPQGIVVKQGDPTRVYDGPQAAANLEKSQADLAKAAADAPYLTRTAAAQVAKAEADARAAVAAADKAAGGEGAKTPDEMAAVRQEAINKILLARSLKDRSQNGWFATGMGAGIAGKIGNTTAYDVAQDTETLKNAGALTRIIEMAKQNGGKNPLTPLSNSDFQALSSSLSNLDTSQSDEQYQRNVGVVEDMYRRAYEGAGGTDLEKALAAARSSDRQNVPPLAQRPVGVAAPTTDGGAGPGGGGRVSQDAQGNYIYDATGPDTYATSAMGQGMSGVNEGIANTLGFPVDAATSIMNLVPQGINLLANTNIPTIEKPFLGSQSIKDGMASVGSILPENGSHPFLRRVGQSVGGASVPIAGTATTLGRAGAGLATAVTGGVGGATANQLFPGNIWADIGGDLLGSGLGAAGMFGAARRTARKTAEAAVPTVQQLKTQASNLYDTAESRGVVAGPNVTANLAGRIGDIARHAEVVDSPMYPHANEATRVIGRYAGLPMNPTQIQVIREGLTEGVQATEGRQRKLARDMLSAFDAETIPLAPELAKARQVASRYLQAGTVQKAIDLAEPRAAQFSGSGPGNALRTEFRGLDRKIIRGDENFNPAVVDAINKVSRGTPGANAATKLGKLAPTGVVSAGLATGVPFAIGNAVGGPAVGAVASATTMGAGMFGRSLSNRMIQNQAREAEMLARNGGALSVPKIIDDALARQMAAQLAAKGGGRFSY